MKKNIVIIILSLVILGLGGYLVYDKVKEKENKKEEYPQNTEQQKNENIEVVDFVNVSFDMSNETNSCEFDYEDTYEIKIPMIDSNKPGAEKINKLIQNDLKEWIDSSKLDEQAYKQKFPRNMSTYSYFKTNKYISIYIEAESGIECRGGGITPYTYVYDMDTDALVSEKELLYLYNVTNDNIIKAIRKEFESNSDIEGYIEQFNLYSYSGLYVNSNEDLVVIVHFGPAEGIHEFIFTK